MGRFIFAAFAGLVRRLPRKAALRLGAAIGSFLYSIAELTKYRGAIRNNIRTAFGDKFSDQEVARMARQHARDLITTYIEAIRMAEFPALYKKGLLAVDGLEHLAKAKEEGKGVIVLSAHMGNYELLLAFMGYLGYPMHIIGVKQSTDWFNEFIVGARELFGCKMLYHKEVTSAQVGEILARNEIVCLVADHHNYGGKARNIVNFFGKPVSVPAGPIAFSTRFGARWFRPIRFVSRVGGTGSSLSRRFNSSRPVMRLPISRPTANCIIRSMSDGSPNIPTSGCGPMNVGRGWTKICSLNLVNEAGVCCRPRKSSIGQVNSLP